VVRLTAILEALPLYDERGLTFPITGTGFELVSATEFLGSQLPGHIVTLNQVRPVTHARLDAVRLGASMVGAVDMMRNAPRAADELLDELTSALAEREAQYPRWRQPSELATV
jgi:hypothetical protein